MSSHPRGPTIVSFMTPTPVTVRPSVSLRRARATMTTHAVHHLPVVDDGVLVGMLTRADIDRAVERLRAAAELARVEDVMSRRPELVAAVTPLADVVDRMRERSLDAVAVTDGRGIVGIFTLDDAFRALVRTGAA